MCCKMNTCGQAFSMHNEEKTAYNLHRKLINLQIIAVGAFQQHKTQAIFGHGKRRLPRQQKNEAKIENVEAIEQPF